MLANTTTSTLQKVNKQAWLLMLITAVGAFLRFYHLDFQSLWLDELYSVKESDPSVSWAETIHNVMLYENKSPLYFLLLKCVFKIFGYSDFTARALSAIAGVVAIPVMYLLGKAIGGNKLGLFSASITAVNAFHIQYSQEARGYAFLFLFVALSFYHLVKFTHCYGLKNALLFGLSISLAIHFHPFALFVLVSQILTVIIFMTVHKIVFMRAIKFLVIIGVEILILISPIVLSIIQSTGISDSWIQMPVSDFYLQYFYTFFGNAGNLNNLLLASILFFIITQFIPFKSIEKNTPIALMLVLCVLLGYLMPYLYSVYKTPILVNRYCIIILPAFILMLAVAYHAIRSRLMSYLFLLVFCGISLHDTWYNKNFYNTVFKAQFRESAVYLNQFRNLNLPIIHNRLPWQFSYYLEQQHLAKNLQALPKNEFCEAVNKNMVSNEFQEGFWFFGGHVEEKPKAEDLQKLDSTYTCVLRKEFYDTWLMLYLPKTKTLPKKKYLLDMSYFDASVKNNIDGDSVVCLWQPTIVAAKKFRPGKGKYALCFVAKGTVCDKEWPRIQVYLNGKAFYNFEASQEFGSTTFHNFELKQDDDLEVSFNLINDKMNQNTKEDRNAFVKFIFLREIAEIDSSTSKQKLP